MNARPTTDAVWSQLNADLRQFIGRRVADSHLADDLLQETFVRVHRNIGTLRDAERLAPWVYQIARNVVRDHHRSRGTTTLELGHADSVTMQEVDGPESGCGGTGWLAEMIRSLPENYRDALQLAEMEERSQQDVAERLGLSLSGAKSRIQRGRAMLKEVLDACCSFERDGRGRVMSCDPKSSQSVCRSCEDQ